MNHNDILSLYNSLKRVMDIAVEIAKHKSVNIVEE
jgi:hypothetical protein